MSGKYEAEYRWALAHPDDGDGEHMLTLAQLYAHRPEQATLGLIEMVAAEIRKKTAATSAPAPQPDEEGK